MSGFTWSIAATVLLAAVLRLPTLGQQSLWTDEATTYGIVAHSLGHVIRTVPKTESTPPVYYVLLWLWTRIFGLSAAGLRSLSALAGLATVGVVGVLGRRLLDERVGLAAALLTAVSPIMVWYSQEARAYALVILAGAVSLLVLLRALEQPDDERRLLAWAICGAVAMAVHYFAAFVVAPEAIWLLVVLRRREVITLRRLVVALGPLVIVAALLIPLAIHQADGRAAFIATDEGSLAARAVRLVKQDILGFNEPLKAVFCAVGGLLIAAAVGLVARRATREEQRRLALPAAVGAGGIVLALLAAVLGADYIDTRNLLPTWPVLVLVVAGGLAVPAAGRAGLVSLGGLTALSLACVVAVVLTPLYQRADWRGVARALGPGQGARAIVGDHLEYTSLSPYVPGLTRVQASASVRVRDVDVFGLALQSTPPPRAQDPPQLSGFRLVKRDVTDTFTLLRYEARSPTDVPFSRLIALGLMPGARGNTVLIQLPDRAR